MWAQVATASSGRFSSVWWEGIVISCVTVEVATPSSPSSVSPEEIVVFCWWCKSQHLKAITLVQAGQKEWSFDVSRCKSQHLKAITLVQAGQKESPFHVLRCKSLYLKAITLVQAGQKESSFHVLRCKSLYLKAISLVQAGQKESLFHVSLYLQTLVQAGQKESSFPVKSISSFPVLRCKSLHLQAQSRQNDSSFPV